MAKNANSNRWMFKGGKRIEPSFSTQTHNDGMIKAIYSDLFKPHTYTVHFQNQVVKLNLVPQIDVTWCMSHRSGISLTPSAVSLLELHEIRCWVLTCAGSTPPSLPGLTDCSLLHLSKWPSPVNDENYTVRHIIALHTLQINVKISWHSIPTDKSDCYGCCSEISFWTMTRLSVLTCWMILCSTTSDMICRWMVPAITLAECLQKWGSLYDRTPSIFSIWNNKTWAVNISRFLFVVKISVPERNYCLM